MFHTQDHHAKFKPDIIATKTFKHDLEQLLLSVQSPNPSNALNHLIQLLLTFICFGWQSWNPLKISLEMTSWPYQCQLSREYDSFATGASTR
jgi:hypothetical protein